MDFNKYFNLKYDLFTLSYEGDIKEEEDYITGLVFNGIYSNLEIKSEESFVLAVSFFAKTRYNRLLNLCVLLKTNEMVNMHDCINTKTSFSSLTDKVFCINSQFKESDRVDAYKYYFEALQIQTPKDKVKKYKLFIREEYMNLIDYCVTNYRNGDGDDIKSINNNPQILSRFESYEIPLNKVKLLVGENIDIQYVTYYKNSSSNNKYSYTFNFLVKIEDNVYVDISQIIICKNPAKFVKALRKGTDIEYISSDKYLCLLMNTRREYDLILSPEYSNDYFITVYKDKEDNDVVLFNFIPYSSNNIFCIDMIDFSKINALIDAFINTKVENYG